MVRGDQVEVFPPNGEMLEPRKLLRPLLFGFGLRVLHSVLLLRYLKEKMDKVEKFGV